MIVYCSHASLLAHVCVHFTACYNAGAFKRTFKHVNHEALPSLPLLLILPKTNLQRSRAFRLFVGLAWNLMKHKKKGPNTGKTK